jgi:hypothetical protein
MIPELEALEKLNAKAAGQLAGNAVIMKLNPQRAHVKAVSTVLLAVVALAIGHAIRHTIYKEVEASVVVHVVGSIAVMGIAMGLDYVSHKREVPRLVQIGKFPLIVALAAAASLGDLVLKKVQEK